MLEHTIHSNNVITIALSATMVGTKRTTRSDVQRNVTQTSKSGVNVSAGRPKRKAAQEAAEKVEAGAKGNGKKRVKRGLLPYLPELDKAGKYLNHDTLLANLPQEIFDKITSLLGPDSQTCLSLTCKLILSIVGREVWSECHSKRQIWTIPKRGHGSWINDRHTLIPLLARDAPHLTECVSCMTLHPPLKHPREHRETSLTKACFGPWSTIDYLPKDDFGRYSLVWEHVLEARKSLTESTDKVGTPIELLSGNFTIRHDRLTYTLISSGRQIKKNLVIKHQHIFHGEDSRFPLKLADIIALRVRLCPHQTTSTLTPAPQARYTNSKLPSGLLTHSIAMAAPKSLRVGLPAPEMFSIPAPLDKKQIDSAIPDSKTLWTCRGCPTKWHVQYDGEGAGQLKITAWHNHGDTAYRAQENWYVTTRIL
jgi:hypothetical protein